MWGAADVSLMRGIKSRVRLPTLPLNGAFMLAGISDSPSTLLVFTYNTGECSVHKVPIYCTFMSTCLCCVQLVCTTQAVSACCFQSKASCECTWCEPARAHGHVRRSLFTLQARDSKMASSSAEYLCVCVCVCVSLNVWVYHPCISPPDTSRPDGVHWNAWHGSNPFQPSLR